MVFNGFNGVKGRQRGSKASRCSKRFKHLHWGSKVAGEFRGSTTIRMERSRGGVAEMQHPFFVALQCVSDRHSKTQHLVAKKTNNFNDLTVKNRLTAVVTPLHVVA